MAAQQRLDIRLLKDAAGRLILQLCLPVEADRAGHVAFIVRFDVDIDQPEVGSHRHKHHGRIVASCSKLSEGNNDIIPRQQNTESGNGHV